MSWDPRRYRRFGTERLRPAVDLLGPVPVEFPDRILDLGCGEGSPTRLLRERWPRAQIEGVDSSGAMLAAAAVHASSITWTQGNLEEWRPPLPVDLVFSNAALHWLDDHASLFPRLLGFLRPGGVLAVQMPRNFQEPSHTCLAEVVRQGPWRERLTPLLRVDPVGSPEFYYGLLAPLAEGLDIWETVYLHPLRGEDPVAAWMGGTHLLPLRQALAPDAWEALIRAYRAALCRAYPRRPDGVTLYAARRIFIVARLPGPDPKG